MVYQPAQPGEIKKKHKRSRAIQILLDFLTLVLVAGATYAIFRLTTVKPENQEVNNPDVVNKVPVEEEEENPAWLSRTIGGWLETFSRDFRVGVAVYDLDEESMLGEAYANQEFTKHAASEMAAKFGSDFGANGEVSANEGVEMLKKAFKHEGMSETEWAEYKQSLLAQPEVYSEERCQGYCKVRDGLAAGFSEKAKVYNENYMDSNGSFYEAYRDMALVEYVREGEKTRNFAVALIGYGFSSQNDFKKLGEMLNRVILAHFENE